MLYLMDLTLTTNITSRDSLVRAPPDPVEKFWWGADRARIGKNVALIG